MIGTRLLLSQFLGHAIPDNGDVPEAALAGYDLPAFGGVTCQEGNFRVLGETWTGKKKPWTQTLQMYEGSLVIARDVALKGSSALMAGTAVAVADDPSAWRPVLAEFIRRSSGAGIVTGAGRGWWYVAAPLSSFKI